MQNEKDGWEKEQEDQKAGNIFGAVFFGFISLPFWFADIRYGIVVTVFWAVVLLIHINSQPKSKEEYEAREKEAIDNQLHLTATPGRYADYSAGFYDDSETVPDCPDCGSSDVVEITNFEKAVAYESWGVGGLNVVDSKYRCCNCGKMWK